MFTNECVIDGMVIDGMVNNHCVVVDSASKCNKRKLGPSGYMPNIMQAEVFDEKIRKKRVCSR